MRWVVGVGMIVGVVLVGSQLVPVRDASANPGYRSWTTTTKTLAATATSTDAALWTPASGKRIVLLGVSISNGATAGSIEIESSNVDVVAPTYLAVNTPHLITGGNVPLWEGSEDAALTVTSSMNATHSVTAWGYEYER